MDDVGEGEERSTPAASSSTSGIEVGIFFAALRARDVIDGRSREILNEGASAWRESAGRAGGGER